MNVDIWTDIVCPFCYIGSTQFEKALSGFAHKDNVTVTHHSFQLTPNAPHEYDGKKSYDKLAEMKNIPATSVKDMYGKIEAAGANEGLTMNMSDVKITNSFNGHRLIHYAASFGKQEEATKALFEAYFTDAINLADNEALVAVAASIGLDKDKTREMLNSEEFSEEVKADIAQAGSLGIQGVPFFIIDNTYGISGAQGVASFSDTLQKAWHEKHPLKMTGTNENANVCVDETCV